jgi:putative SOS response-associated peptidase YedK
MCGRFALSAKTKDIEKLVSGAIAESEINPRYNIAPSQNIAAVLNIDRQRIIHLRWGLVPFWAKDESIGNKMINARLEGIFEKPAFKHAIRRRRCLIFADGFYEWKPVEGSKRKIPYYISMKTSEPFTFAGIWETWRQQGHDELLSASIITTEPNDLIKDIHNRMPCIIPSELRMAWLTMEELSPGRSPECLLSYPTREMQAWQVSFKVNNPGYDAPDCMERVA